MKEFFEKTLEDIIFNTDNELLCEHGLLLAKNCYISDVVNQACGDCIYYLTCNSESRDKQICDNYDNEP